MCRKPSQLQDPSRRFADLQQKDAAGGRVHLLETMCVLSVIFITKGLRDSSICCLHFVLDQQPVPRIFNHSPDGSDRSPLKAKDGTDTLQHFTGPH